MADVHALVECLQNSGKVTPERVAKLADYDVDALLELSSHGENVVGGQRGKGISEVATQAIGLVLDM
jgi:hypothetical protein